jgi:REP element-mobilizing transposase RayT
MSGANSTTSFEVVSYISSDLVRCGGFRFAQPTLRVKVRLTCPRHDCFVMSEYRLLRIAGGCHFFTVNLLERRPNDLLVRHIDHLRAAVREVRRAWPFGIDGWVVLPDHLHCIWTLPDGDDNFATRWRLIKAGFARRLAGDRAAVGFAVPPGRARHLAAAVLGTHHPRRPRFRPPHGLPALQPGEARLCRPAGRLAILDVPPPGPLGPLSRRLGQP